MDTAGNKLQFFSFHCGYKSQTRAREEIVLLLVNESCTSSSTGCLACNRGRFTWPDDKLDIISSSDLTISQACSVALISARSSRRASKAMLY